jgi:hypothetical protein
MKRPTTHRAHTMDEMAGENVSREYATWRCIGWNSQKKKIVSRAMDFQTYGGVSRSEMRL